MKRNNLTGLIIWCLLAALCWGCESEQAETNIPAVDQHETAPSGNNHSRKFSAETLSVSDQGILPGDTKNGWRLFFSNNCIDCHSLWGVGGNVGPDLGRTSISHVSASGISAQMWNHVPTMRQKMEEEGVQFKELSLSQMADIFAFLYFIRYMDEPGDPQTGKKLIEEKKCNLCHSIHGQGGTIGPDLEKWGNYVNPIVWAQAMWENAATMEREMKQREMKWPELHGDDMVHMIAYIRSVSSSRERIYLNPGSPANGKNLFDKKGCSSCHSVGGESKRGPDLGEVEIPRSLSQMASLMWNHFPQMQEVMADAGIEQQKLSSQEMADVVAYLFAVRYYDRPGSVEKGKEIFMKKHCVRCHHRGDIGGAVGPRLDPLKGRASPIFMAQAMWNHGPTMLARLTQMGIAWPSISLEEMVDLIEFLNKGPSE